MKKIYITLALLGGALCTNAQQIWDNFEDIRRADYDFISGTLIPYSENPSQTGVNTSLVAASYTRNAADLFDVILLDAPMADVSDYLTGTKQMSMKVYSPAAGINLQITLENSTLAQPANFPTGRHSEYTAVTTVANQWETLTFTFANQPDASVSNTNVNRMVILFAPNTNTNPQFRFDDLMGPELANDPCVDAVTNPLVLNDFECNQNVNFIFSHAGINFTRVVNPNSSGLNTSSHVARYVRNIGENTDVIIGRFNGNLQLSATNSLLALDVIDANAPSLVVLSLQNLNGDVILAMNATTVASTGWQTLLFDASEVVDADDIEQFVILFAPGVNNSNLYFFDNFRFDVSLSTPILTAQNNAFKVWPNPARDFMNMEFNLSAPENLSIQIFDISGKLVQTQSYSLPAGEQQIKLNVQGLQKGIYMCALKTRDQVTTKKIVIN
ncbi:MAG: T9SS type A sorting domain-containing protein [Luteibaculaceae bacterium]